MNEPTAIEIETSDFARVFSVLLVLAGLAASAYIFMTASAFVGGLVLALTLAWLALNLWRVIRPRPYAVVSSKRITLRRLRQPDRVIRSSEIVGIRIGRVGNLQSLVIELRNQPAVQFLSIIIKPDIFDLGERIASIFAVPFDDSFN